MIGAERLELPVDVGDLLVEVVDHRDRGEDAVAPRVGEVEAGEQLSALAPNRSDTGAGVPEREQLRMDAVLEPGTSVFSPGFPICKGAGRISPWRTVAELDRLGMKIGEVAVDGGFKPGPTNTALADLRPKTVFIAGRQEPASKRTTRRLRRYRTGEEGRISHLKRRYGLDRSRLKATKAGRSGLSG